MEAKTKPPPADRKNEMTETTFGKQLFDVFFIFSLSYLLTSRGRGLWVLQQPTTRGPSRCFSLKTDSFLSLCNFLPSEFKRADQKVSSVRRNVWSCLPSCRPSFNRHSSAVPPPLLRVTAASGCYPADTLKPGDECLSHYRYDFSRQERALRSIAFIKGTRRKTFIEPNRRKKACSSWWMRCWLTMLTKLAEDDVHTVYDVFIQTWASPPPLAAWWYSVMWWKAKQLYAHSAVAEDVPEEQQPEEPKDSSVQNVQLKHQQETSNQDLDSVEEPAQSAPAQGLAMEPVDSDVRVSNGEPGQKNNQEEEKEDPVKEGNVCEDQGGTSTQQVRFHSCRTQTQKCLRLQNQQLTVTWAHQQTRQSLKTLNEGTSVTEKTRALRELRPSPRSREPSSICDTCPTFTYRAKE